MRYINDCLNFAIRTSLILLLVAPAAADNFEHIHVLRDTEYQLVDSETIGRSFHVYVMLPDGYDDNPENDYRTIYLLDGGLHLALLGSYHRYLHSLGDTDAAIIVAIAYGSQTFSGGNYRSTDFTAPSDERDYWGGAGKYQTFLADELIPWVETSYRADPADRVLFGQSLGGQFVLYTAQTRPDLFKGYIASNPALHTNVDFFLEQKPSQPSGAKLFVGSATRDVDRFLLPRKRWIKHWEAVDAKPWQLRIESLIDHTHASAPPASLRQGLAWIDSASE